jgi:hypothetical protein
MGRVCIGRIDPLLSSPLQGEEEHAAPASENHKHSRLSQALPRTTPPPERGRVGGGRSDA